MLKNLFPKRSDCNCDNDCPPDFICIEHDCIDTWKYVEFEIPLNQEREITSGLSEAVRRLRGDKDYYELQHRSTFGVVVKDVTKLSYPLTIKFNKDE